MFVIRFEYNDDEPRWAGRWGKGTTGGGWGWMPFEEAETFESVAAAQTILDTHYQGRRARIVHAFDDAPAGDDEPPK